MAAPEHFTYAIIGGGIAGVTCAEHLDMLDGERKTVLVSGSDMVKMVTNILHVTRSVDMFDVEDKHCSFLCSQCPSLTIKPVFATALNTDEKIIHLSSGETIHYEKLCMCTGAVPKVIFPGHPHVLYIRDTESARSFQRRINQARRIVVVGNGGIATEMVYEITGVEVVWAVRDAWFTAAFIDPGAAEFFGPQLRRDQPEDHRKQKPSLCKRKRYQVHHMQIINRDEDIQSNADNSAGDINKEKTNSDYNDSESKGERILGGSLGPDWHVGLDLTSQQVEAEHLRKRRVVLETKVEVVALHDPDAVKHDPKLRAMVQETAFRTTCKTKDSQDGTSNVREIVSNVQLSETKGSSDGQSNFKEVGSSDFEMKEEEVKVTRTGIDDNIPHESKLTDLQVLKSYMKMTEPKSTPIRTDEFISRKKSRTDDLTTKEMCPEEQRKGAAVEDDFDNAGWAVYVELSNGKVYGCDFVVSATGVSPNTKLAQECGGFKTGADGGLSVGEDMMTSVGDVFAAGDVCTPAWIPAQHWHQMRLWTQARQMGAAVAKSMWASVAGEEIYQDFCFELFTHATRFFDHKVVLLGLYNGQRLDGHYEILLRMTPGLEYIKVVLKDGRMQGALLVGETDLEETFENLILNNMDLSSYGADLLDPDVDIEDYFD